MGWGVGPEKLRILVEVRSGQSGFEDTYKPKITSVQTHTIKITPGWVRWFRNDRKQRKRLKMWRSFSVNCFKNKCQPHLQEVFIAAFLQLTGKGSRSKDQMKTRHFFWVINVNLATLDTTTFLMMNQRHREVHCWVQGQIANKDWIWDLNEAFGLPGLCLMPNY